MADYAKDILEFHHLWTKYILLDFMMRRCLEFIKLDLYYLIILVKDIIVPNNTIKKEAHVFYQ